MIQTHPKAHRRFSEKVKIFGISCVPLNNLKAAILSVLGGHGPAYVGGAAAKRVPRVLEYLYCHQMIAQSHHHCLQQGFQKSTSFVEFFSQPMMA